jgi:hypothetical protein
MNPKAIEAARLLAMRQDEHLSIAAAAAAYSAMPQQDTTVAGGVKVQGRS